MNHVVTIHDAIHFTVRHPPDEGLHPECGLDRWLSSHINSPWEPGTYNATQTRDRWKLRLTREND